MPKKTRNKGTKASAQGRKATSKKENGKEKLEAVLLLLKMTGQIGLYQIETPPDGLLLHVNPGHRFQGEDLAAYIADLSEGSITAGRIKVRQ
jgi:hypothetical protein